MRHPNRATAAAALAITLALPAAATAAGPSQDLRNPDQRLGDSRPPHTKTYATRTPARQPR